MTYAFIGKLLRVNLTEGTTTEEPLRMEWAELFIGGAGLATRYLYDEVPGGTDPMGPENKLIFMTGPLTGTTSASAGNITVPHSGGVIPTPRGRGDSRALTNTDLASGFQAFFGPCPPRAGELEEARRGRRSEFRG